MQKRMTIAVVNSRDENLYTYFAKTGITSKEVMAQIICRFLCRERENFGRPLTTLTDKQFKRLLEYCAEEIIRENKGTNTIIRDKNGDVIYEGIRTHNAIEDIQPENLKKHTGN